MAWNSGFAGPSPKSCFFMIEPTAFSETSLAVSHKKKKVCYENIADFLTTFAGSWVKMRAYKVMVNQCMLKNKILYCILEIYSSDMFALESNISQYTMVLVNYR